jgi:hypothetical protein
MVVFKAKDAKWFADERTATQRSLLEKPLLVTLKIKEFIRQIHYTVPARIYTH